MFRRTAVALLAFSLLLSSAILQPISAQQMKTITIGTLEPLTNLDPADAGDVFSWEVLTHLASGLTRQKTGSLQYELALAASHTISDDGLTHTFTIRPDAAFDDGTPITAQIFADSIKRVLRLNGAGAAVVTPYVQTATVNTDGALILKLTAPIPYLEQLVALPPYFPVHPTTFPADRLNRTPIQLIGNGVYKLGALEAGRTLTLVANPAWKGPPPLTGTIVLKQYAKSADLREAIKTHQIDIAWRGLPFDDIGNAIKVKGIGYQAAPGLQTFYLLLTQITEPYNDPLARQALMYMLDRERAVKNGLVNTGTSLYTLLPLELSGGQGPIYPKFDKAQAQPILTKGDFSKYKQIGSELQISRALYGELYASAVDEMSSSLSLQEAFHIIRTDTEPKAFLDEIDRGTFRLMVVGLTPVVPHPDAYLRPLLASKGSLALGTHYANPTIDTMLDQAALIADPAVQTKLYSDVQAAALKDVVAVPLWQNQQLLVAWDSVSGIVIEPNFLLRYDRLTVR